MSAPVGYWLGQELRRKAQSEKLNSALKQKRDMVEVSFEWQDKQTADAVHFPTLGWIPKAAMRWKRGDLILAWDNGRSGDTFLVDREFLSASQFCPAGSKS